MQWLEIKVVAGRDGTEAVSQKMMDLGAGGVSVEDELDWETAKRHGMGDIFPQASATDSDRVAIRGYFPLSFLSAGKDEELASFLAALPSFGLKPAEMYSRRVDETDWEQAWKQYWRPTPVGKKLLVLPAWLEAPPEAGRQVLRLDPGAAFGTGTHESTKLCLELLEEQITGRETVLDIGCGSGILAIAARLLGAGNVTAVDVDEAAVRAAHENALRNNLPDMPVIQADVFVEEAWRNLGRAGIVLANLTADALLAIKGRLRHVLCSGGLVIASGIVRAREEEVVNGYLREGYAVKEKRSAGEWVALLLEWKE